MKLDKYTVGKRYGKAIFELAVENNNEDSIFETLQTVKGIFTENSDLGNILSDDRLNQHEKRSLMDTINHNYDGLVHDALEVIFQYERMYDILMIIEEFEKEYYETKGIVSAIVTTTVPLTQTQKQHLAQAIATRFGYKRAELIEEIDPSIIGGVIIEVNHQVIDGSIKNKFEQLKKSLSQ
ncbi:MAG TPA: F0F1 ATP synthase subunit delta [Candidatus Tetragenococcus pullicola]|nr:F0F1 ATP synthase subunit delta [Candidatus Tetragenococcus pullicola]